MLVEMGARVARPDKEERNPFTRRPVVVEDLCIIEQLKMPIVLLQSNTLKR